MLKNNKSGFADEKTLKSLLFGVVLGLLIILLLLILFALILSVSTVSIKLIPALTALSMAAGTFVGGLLAAKKIGQNGLLFGILCGFVLFLLFTAVSLIASAAAPGFATLTRLIIFVISGGIGGIVGVNQKAKRKKIV